MRAFGRREPTFNRMSGIQEWANAIFLFVNLDGVSYLNSFEWSQADLLLSWFAQPTQSEDSPVIVSIISSEKPIFLFVKQTAEYFSMGRLQYRSHQPSKRPMKFQFRISAASNLLVCDVAKELMPEVFN